MPLICLVGTTQCFLFIYGQDPVNVIYYSDTVCVSHFQTASKGAEWPGLSVSMKWDFKKMSPPQTESQGFPKGRAGALHVSTGVSGSWEARGRLAGVVSSTLPSPGSVMCPYT